MIKYDSYMDSGIEWLDALPSSWSTKRIKDISSVISKGTTPSTEGEAYTDFGVRYIKAENINENGTVSEVPAFYISDKTNKLLARSILKSNDLLMVIAGATTGKVAVLKHEQLPANTNQAVCFIRLHNSEKISLRFKYYFLNSSFLQSQVWLYAVTSAQPNLPMAVLSRFHLCYPPLKEQTAIAQYLDSKTQAIDKKINLLEKKIGYYKELRKSIINEIVSGKRIIVNGKLVEPVETKDSGIDWIGQIPEHWEVKRLKDKLKFSKGKNANMYNQDYVKDLKNQGAYPVYSGQTENDGLMAEINTYEYSFDKTVLLVSTVGAKAMEVKAIYGKFTLSQNCALIETIKANEKCDFYFYYLIELFREERKIIPTIMQPSLRIEDLVKYNLILPPLSEQTKIATYLDHKTKTIDKIVGNIQNQITTLKELRKTLINDVVTGKIKVVNF